MQQSKTSSAILLKKILADLKENSWNYTNKYIYRSSKENFVYSANVEKLKKMAEQAILNKEYQEALTYYMNANQYISNPEYKFDVQINLLNNILFIIKKKKNDIIHVIEYYKELAIANKDDQMYIEMEKNYIIIAKPSIKEILKQVHTLVSLELPYASSQLLDFVSKKDQLSRYQHHIQYLKAKNIEVTMNRNCLFSDTEIVFKYISKIRFYFDCGHYHLVIKEASKALYNTNYPIFYYYLGKAYYKNKDYDSAINFFNIYKELNAEKYAKVNLYLYKIYRNRKDFSRANKLMSDVEDIKATYGDYAFDSYNYIPYNNRNNKFDDKYDAKPVKILQKIHMNEEDFLKRD